MTPLTKTSFKKKTTNLSFPEVAVILISYNTAEVTIQAIDAVLASEGVRCSVYLIDNASSDRTLSRLKRKYQLRASKKSWEEFQQTLHDREKRRLFPNIKVDVTAVDQVWRGQSGEHQLFVLPSHRNLGFGRANNLMAAWTTAPYVLFLNSDAFVTPETIAAMVAQYPPSDEMAASAVVKSEQKLLDNLGILAAELRNPDGSLQRQGGTLPTLTNIFRWITFLDDIPFISHVLSSYQHHEADLRRLRRKHVAKVGWVGGTAMMISRSCLEEIGGFDEKIFMYAEDIDLCWRATKRHWDVGIASTAKVTHLGSASSGKKSAIHGEISGIIYLWEKQKTPTELWVLKHILRFGLRLRVVIFGILRRYGQQRIYQEALELVR